MKPFFSIRIDYNPADSEEMVAFDANSIRLSLARETDPIEDGGRNFETYQNMAERIINSIDWLRGVADINDEGLIDCIFFDMRTRFREQFLKAIEETAECADDDEVEEMRKAIVRGERAASGEKVDE